MPALLTRRRIAMATAAALAVVTGAGGTALALTASGSPHVVSLPLDARTRAALMVSTGTPVLDVSVGRLGSTLLRVSTPDDAPVRPVLSEGALVVLSLAGTKAAGRPAPDYAVHVVLNSAVTWSLDLAGGTDLSRVDLRGGKVGGIAVTAGSDILDVSLPRPAGTLPFLLAGGASQFLLSLPGGVPAQVTVGGGASFVSIDGRSLTGVAGGTVLTPPGWASATSRFDIHASSGFSRLTVSRWSPSGS